MNEIPKSIPKQPVLTAAEDYYRLRKEGIGYIEKMASNQWTDYNTHDPGITILETLCYTITDLAYRSHWDIQDLLTQATPPADYKQPYPDQAFFSAREILTINPLTPDDFRRLLIDLPGISNAWIVGKACACEFFYFAWCENQQLVLGFQDLSQESLLAKKVAPLGSYDVLLELESDPELGDLNDNNIEQSFSLGAEGKFAEYTLELRFPTWSLLDKPALAAFLGNKDPELKLELKQFWTLKNQDLILDDDGLQQYWRNILYIGFDVTIGNKIIPIRNVSLRIFCAQSTSKALKISTLSALLCNGAPIGFVQKYRSKLLLCAAKIEKAKTALHQHRNLDEDYCRIDLVSVQNIGVCADVEVKADADIEWVQAKIWLEIENYFNPPVHFYALQELLGQDTPVEDIFNGPQMQSGLIKADELTAADQKSVLRASDIINRLMQIDGVIAVNQLLLSKYDSEGNLLKGAADPTWENSKPLFDANKSSASWLLYLDPQHQPRLYRNISRFLFYKNGLPSGALRDETNATLTQLRGELQRPKFNNSAQDIPIPVGSYRNPEDYYPLQYSFPLTYGIGPQGLPSHVNQQRRAQARQLKAYLMVYEQILANTQMQLAHCADLFSLDQNVNHTYFVKEFNETLIQGYSDLVQGLDSAKLEGMTESSSEFHERRNRFLDHLMARFGEQFTEYALLLTNFQGQKIAQDRLIENKIALLKAYPLISRDRGRAFNYRLPADAVDNLSGIKQRLSLLLGYPNLKFDWTITQSAGQFDVQFKLLDQNQKPWLEQGKLSVLAANADAAQKQAYHSIMARLIKPDAYLNSPENQKYRLILQNKDNATLAQHPELFLQKDDADNLRDELLSWSANQRALIVEHLLLRPKFPGDALYPACSDGGCNACGEEDPYSFRISFVMPGWTSPYNANMELRRFAERTIQQEIPAHLLSKIVWVSNDGFIENLNDPVFNALQDLLFGQAASNGAIPAPQDIYDSALNIYRAFATVFNAWYLDKFLNFLPASFLGTALAKEFETELSVVHISSIVDLKDIWGRIQEIMLDYFLQIATYGWQFERFEAMWNTWLSANARFDWSEERLQDCVQTLLQANLQTGKVADLCPCATAVLMQYGTDFYGWLEQKLQNGIGLDKLLPTKNIRDFNPREIKLREGDDSKSPFCGAFSFKPGTAQKLADLLKRRYFGDENYPGYVEVSYRLRLVVKQLSLLRNSYPGATLHDCSVGGDQNPVRLGDTALGNYPLHPTRDT